jgi:threonine/homoserine/homoserine lactone efflux protein
MLTKIFGSVIGTITTIFTLMVVAIIGVAVVFIGYFLFWGILGLAIVLGIAFLIWAAIDEFNSKPRNTNDPEP